MAFSDEKKSKSTQRAYFGKNEKQLFFNTPVMDNTKKHVGFWISEIDLFRSAVCAYLQFRSGCDYYFFSKPIVEPAIIMSFGGLISNMK